jgi:hypothetical protein
MTLKFKIGRRGAAIAAGGVLLAAALGGGAQAITDTVFRYSTTKTGYYTIGHFGMIPDSAADAANYNNDLVGGITSLGAGHCFSSNVHLPQGATMKSVRLWYNEANQGTSFVVLYRQSLSTTPATAPIVSRTLPASGSSQTTAFPIATWGHVNNAGFAYGLAVCLGSGARLFSARIAYTYNTAGD